MTINKINSIRPIIQKSNTLNNQSVTNTDTATRVYQEETLMQLKQSLALQEETVNNQKNNIALLWICVSLIFLISAHDFRSINWKNIYGNLKR